MSSWNREHGRRAVATLLAQRSNPDWFDEASEVQVQRQLLIVDKMSKTEYERLLQEYKEIHGRR